MRDLKVKLHFSEKFHKKCFLDCFTEERLKKSKKSNRGKDLVMHYGIRKVSELDGSVHYSKQGKVNYQSDDEKDRLFNDLVEESAERIKKEFLEESRKRYEITFHRDFLKEAIKREIECTFDSTLLDLRINKQEGN